MLQQPSEKAAYHDASAYFSEEEWSILQQWQEELHQNVMKEIDHALTSLGPVIATMVFSLRAKAEAEPCLMEDQRSERRRNSHTLPSCMIMNPDTLLRITKNENLHPNGPLDTNDIRRKDCLSAEEQQTSIYIDDFGEEIGENSTDSHSGHDIISFYIKEEGEAYYIDTQDHKQKESTYNSTGVGSEMRKMKASHLIADTEKITGNVLHEEGERNMHQGPKKEANTKGQQWAGSHRTLQEEKIAHCEGGSVSQEYATLNLWTSNILGSDSHNNILPHLPNAKVPVCRQISYGPYACPECEKMFKTNQDLTRHQRTHSGERPYHCTECGKRFARSHHLTAHKRTHTGERPFQCTVCGKSFSLKGNLKAHHNTHLIAYRKQHKR